MNMNRPGRPEPIVLNHHFFAEDVANGNPYIQSHFTGNYDPLIDQQPTLETGEAADRQVNYFGAVPVQHAIPAGHSAYQWQGTHPGVPYNPMQAMGYPVPPYHLGVGHYPNYGEGSQHHSNNYRPPHSYQPPLQIQPMNGYQQPPFPLQNQQVMQHGNSLNPFENPLQPIPKRPPYSQSFNPYPKQQFMQKQQPSGLYSVLNQFKTQDGSFDINKMMNTAGQVMNTVSQVSAMAKGIGGFFKA
jgi:hypothetical protein